MGPEMEGQSVNSPQHDVKFIPKNYGDSEDENLTVRTKKWCQRTFTVRLLKQRFPIIQWMPHYTLQSAFRDCLAGFTVALTAIPQGIAYGAVAGLPVEYGLYTAFAGPFVYALLGSVRQVTVGPTAVMALMTHEYAVRGGPQYAILLSFLAGIFELITGLLNLGWIMDFISGPVISGFCSAAATAVIASQLKSMLGLTFKGSSFGQVVCGIFTNWQDIRPWDALLGLTFILFLIALKYLAPNKKSCFGTRCLLGPYVHRTLWFVSTCRNALAVIFGCTLAYLLEFYGYQPFRLTGDIKPGIPSFQFPLFSFERSTPNDSFSEIIPESGNVEMVTFVDFLSDIGSGLVMIPIIAILEQVAIAKAFSNGKKTDSSQEMIAVGVGSIFCSCFGSFPLTASFSRSSVLAASGGKTQFASFFNGCVVLVALGFLMPVFYYIPKSVLAAVIIVAVVALIEVEEILPMWRGRRIELIPFGTTFFCCLFINIEYGIMIGIQVHLILLLYEATRSTSDLRTVKKGQNKWIIVKANQSLFFPGVEHFRDALTKVFDDLQETETFLNRTVVIDMSLVHKVDHTSLKMLKTILSSWTKNGMNYVFSNVAPQVEKHLRCILPDCTTISHCSEIDIAGDDKEGESLLLEISGFPSSMVPSEEP